MMILPLGLTPLLICGTVFGLAAPFQGNAEESDGVDDTGNKALDSLPILEERDRTFQVTPFLTTTTITPTLSTSFSLATPPTTPSSRLQSALSILTVSSSSQSHSSITTPSTPTTPTTPTITPRTSIRSSNPKSPPPSPTFDITNIIEITPATSTSSRKASKQPADGGIGPLPSDISSFLKTFQTPDPAQFGIGPPPPGFRAPKKAKPLKNTDLNSAPF